MLRITTIMLSGLLVSLCPIAPINVSIAEAPVEEKSIEELVALYSDLYDVPSETMWKVMKCENRDLDPNLQSKLYYTFSNPALGIVKGEQEYSFGLVQINLHYHPEITMEQATDPEFSISYLAEQLSLGHGSMWSCY